MSCEEPIETTAPRRIFPGIKGAGLLMLVGWGAGLSLAPLLAKHFGLTGTTAVGNIVSLGLMAALGLRFSRTAPRECLSIRPFPPGLVWPLVVMAFSGTIIVAELSNWTEYLLPMPDSIRTLFAEILTASNRLEWFQRAGLLVVMAPVTEEIVFRGVFLHGFLHNYGPTRGILLSGLCFGVFHLIPWQALGAACVGVLLGLIVYRTGSIFAGMIFHACWNGLPLLALTVMPPNALTGYDTLQSSAHIPASALLLSALIFALGLHAFWRQTAESAVPPA